MSVQMIIKRVKKAAQRPGFVGGRGKINPTVAPELGLYEVLGGGEPHISTKVNWSILFSVSAYAPLAMVVFPS